MKMWKLQFKDQTTHSLQSDLDLHCPQNILVLSSVRKELIFHLQKLMLLVLTGLHFFPW